MSPTSVLVFTFICGCSGLSGARYEDLEMLHKTLLDGYNPNLRPVNQSSQTVEVSVELSVSKIAALDEAKEVLITWFNVHLTWIDERLTWDSEHEYPDVLTLNVPQVHIWFPRLHTVDSLRKDDDKFHKDNVVQVSSSGQVDWFRRIQTQTPCPLDVKKFPFDQQMCTVTLVTGNGKVNEVNITNVHLLIELLIGNGIWDFDDISENTKLVEYNGQKRSGLSVTLKLNRRCEYYFFNLIFPLFIIIMSNPLVVLVNGNSGEKVSVSVTYLLSFTVLITLLSGMMPGTPHLAVYLYCNFQVSGDMVVYCIVSTRCKFSKLLKYFGWLVRKRKCCVTPKQDDDLDTEEEHDSKEDNSALEDELRTRLDRLALVLFLLIDAGLAVYLICALI